LLNISPTNLAALLGIFAIAGVIEKALLHAGFGLCLRRLLHPPSMAAFRFLQLAFLGSLSTFLRGQVIWGKLDGRTAALALALPFGISLDPPSPAYQEAMPAITRSIS